MSELRYYAADLHLHTPASKCFEDPSVTAEDIVRTSIARGLDIIAITDHNTGEWIDRVKEAARGTSLTIIPGVEITCSGGSDGSIHLIALFPCDFGTISIANFLGSIGITAEDFGKEAAISNRSVHDVITAVHDFGGLPVLAHANSTHGVLATMRGNTRTEIINHPYLMAAEGTDFENQDKQKRGTRVVDLLSGHNESYRKLAVYQASDNPGKTNGTHGLDGIGTRISYFKMSEKTLEGLRQCFTDPDVRIRIGQQPEYNFPMICYIEVSGGFLKGRRVDFAPGINSILGGKGVGKSILIELIRFGLGQVSEVSEIAQDHRSKLEKRFGYGSEVKLGIVAEGGAKYEIIRKYDQVDNSLTVVNLDTGEEYGGDISVLFPILAYSQTEVIHIAHSPEAQLRLIDQFFDHHSFHQDIASATSSLRENDQRLASSIEATQQLASIEYQIKTLQEQIKIYDQQLQNQLFNQIKVLERRQQVISETKMVLSQAREHLVSALNQIDDLTIPESVVDDNEDQNLIEILAAARYCLDELRADLRRTLHKVGQVTGNITTKADGWHQEHASTFEDYRNLLVEAGGNAQTLEAKRKKTARNIAELENRKNTLLQVSKVQQDLLEERKMLLDKLDELRKNYFEARLAQFKTIEQGSGGKLCLRLEHATNKGRFLGEIISLLRGSRVRQVDIQRMVDHLTPRRLVDLALNGDFETLAVEGQLAPQVAAMIVNHLTTSSLADLLAAQHLYYPEDTPTIEFRKPDGAYYPLEELSIGQKSTALLIIALVEGTMPVIIDQPEDSLDIPSVWEDIVLKLRQGKEKRQFILTTHNSSVAVASDSDQFVIVTSTSEHANVMARGGIDLSDVRDEVIRHLEGGEDSYHLKRRKYNF